MKARAMKVVITACATVLVHCATAQPWGPCPQGHVAPERITASCANGLPRNAELWMRGPDGQPCYCECAGLQTATLQQYNAMLAERAQIWITASSTFISPIVEKLDKGILIRADPIEGLSVYRTLNVPAPDQQVVEIDIDDLCGDFDELIGVIRSINSSGLQVPFAVHVKSEISTEDGINHVPFNSMGAYNSEQWITVPSIFITHTEVKSELMAFLLLHEIGHEVDPEEESECHADFFAADIGMRAVYPGPGLIFALEAAGDQLLAYKRALRNDANWDPGHSRLQVDGECQAEGSYPEFNCRKEAIKHISECFEKGPSCSFGYAGDCWSTPETYLHHITGSYPLCDPNEICGTIEEEETMELVTGLFVNDQLGHAVTYEFICNRYPWFCGRHNLKPTAQVNKAVSGRLKSRFDRSLMKSRTRLNSLLKARMPK